MQSSIELKGQKKLEKKLKKIKKAAKFFDPIVRSVSISSQFSLVGDTPVDTGRTRRAWQKPKKIADSVYEVENTHSGAEGKISVAQVINDGRKSIRPKRAKLLYIPISRRAKEKKFGVPIKANLKFGKDFVLTKFAKAVVGTKFIDKNNIKSSRELTRRIIKKIRSVFR